MAMGNQTGKTGMMLAQGAQGNYAESARCQVALTATGHMPRHPHEATSPAQSPQRGIQGRPHQDRSMTQGHESVL